jgi:steroid 5-alpha reductase family enzyme
MQIYHYLLIAIAINILLFIPGYLLKTDKLTDLSYSISFITLAIIGALVETITLGKLAVILMVIIWGIRLGGFLFIRIQKMKKDNRFDGIRESFLKFLRFWFLQGVSVWIIMLPSLFLLSGNGDEVCWIGGVIWLVGLIIETVADLQKYRFKQDPANKDEFISTGLWKYSRHPNYFGEIMCWVGIYIFAFPALTSLQQIIALASPLYIATILIFLTGIPPLEKSADKRWGSRKDYQEYKKRTSILIPWLLSP